MRFKNYDDNYREITLKDVCTLITKGTTPAKFSTNGINFIKIDSLNGNYVDNSKVTHINESIHNTLLSRSILEENDILLAIAGATVGKHCIIQKSNLPANTNQALAIIRLNKHLLPYYLLAFFDTNYLPSYIKLICAASAQPNLNLQQVGQIKLNIPTIQEQEKVCHFIQLLDKRISVQNKIISKYETLIKGISNLLLCKIEDCPTIKLSDILIEYNDKARQNNEYPILSSTMNGIFVQSEYFNKQAASEETVGYKKVPYGYCTYRSMSDTGEFRFNIQKIVEIGIVSPAYPVFTSVEYDMRFIAFYLNNSTRLRKQILEIKEGGTRFALPFSKLRNLTIPKITRLQQTKIVDIYCLFSRKKELEQRFLLKLKEQKDYLLSKMFI